MEIKSTEQQRKLIWRIHHFLLPLSWPLLKVASHSKNAEELRSSLEYFYNNTPLDEESVKRWFSTDYVQVVDGKILYSDDSIKHLKILERDTKSLRVEVVDAAYTGDTLADRHIVHVVKKDGNSMILEVLAFFRLKDGKIVSLNKNTRLVSGEHTDKDLGSRTE